MGADTDGGGGNINDILNRNTNKQFSSFSRPLVSILALNYTIPKMGSNKYLRYAVSDWYFATSLQYASGLPILVPATAPASEQPRHRIPARHQSRAYSRRALVPPGPQLPLLRSRTDPSAESGSLERPGSWNLQPVSGIL